MCDAVCRSYVWCCWWSRTLASCWAVSAAASLHWSGYCHEIATKLSSDSCSTWWQRLLWSCCCFTICTCIWCFYDYLQNSSSASAIKWCMSPDLIHCYCTTCRSAISSSSAICYCSRSPYKLIATWPCERGASCSCSYNTRYVLLHLMYNLDIPTLSF